MNFLVENFKHLTTTPQNVEQLKKLVLQLAVQGKLTSKWRTENTDIEPAKVLYEKIKLKKEQLIKEGQIKRGTKQPPAKKLEISKPNSWLLVDLDDITQYITDGTHQTPRYVERGKMFLSAQNVKPFKFMPDNHKFVTEEAYLDYIKNRKPEKGDILVGRVGSKGEAAVIDRDLEFAIYVSLGLVKTFQAFTSPSFIAIVMNSPYGVEYATGNMSSLGASAGNFNLGRIRSFPVPFPPLDEQNEIVSTVEKLFSEIDQLHALAQKKITLRERVAKALFGKINNPLMGEDIQQIWQQLTTNFKTLTQSKDSIKQLRQTILQLAVQGKLTAKWREENPNVEPASVLFEKIKTENEEIKKAYNLRNQKPLLKILNNEIPFEIPENWNWQRLGNVFYTTSGGTPSRGNTDFWNGTIPWLKSGELTDGLITKEPEEKITELGHKNSSTYLFPEETLLIALYGATAGKLGILKFPSTTNQAICGFFTNKFICTEYLFYYLWAFRSKILSDSWGQAQPNISQDYLKKFCFALPPFEEQLKIVEVVKQQMTLCDELEKKIEKRDSYQERIMQAVVKQAFQSGAKEII